MSIKVPPHNLFLLESRIQQQRNKEANKKAKTSSKVKTPHWKCSMRETAKSPFLYRQSWFFRKRLPMSLLLMCTLPTWLLLSHYPALLSLLGPLWSPPPAPRASLSSRAFAVLHDSALGSMTSHPLTRLFTAHKHPTSNPISCGPSDLKASLF